MLGERCAECGFVADHWTDGQARAALAAMPGRWAAVVDSLTDTDLRTRPVVDRWSIAEYVDHVRETLFAMRFLLDVAVDSPGTDLGPAPEPRFEHEPRALDPRAAQRAMADEVRQLCDRLDTVTPVPESRVVLGSRTVDVHWIVRNSLHEASHHLGDIERLRYAITTRSSSRGEDGCWMSRRPTKAWP